MVSKKREKEKEKPRAPKGSLGSFLKD